MKNGEGHYGRLFMMAALGFASMYVLMYAMVDAGGNIYPNVNQLYMAGLMTAPMVLVELALMRRMFANKKLNLVIAAASALAFAVFFVLIRQQSAVTDRQFLKSMIPHHAGAILMCERAPIRDDGVQALCRRILESQRSEIEEMKSKLVELDGGRPKG